MLNQNFSKTFKSLDAKDNAYHFMSTIKGNPGNPGNPGHPAY